MNFLKLNFNDSVARFSGVSIARRFQRSVLRWLFVVIATQLLGLALPGFALNCLHAAYQQSQTYDQSFSTIQLQNVEAERVVGLLNDLFGNRSDTSILLDRKKNRVVIQGPQSVQVTARNLVQAIEQSAAKSPPANPPANPLGNPLGNPLPSASAFNSSTESLPSQIPLSFSGNSIKPNVQLNSATMPHQASFNNVPSTTSLLSNPQSPPNTSAARTRWLYVSPEHQVPLQQKLQTLLGQRLQREQVANQERFLFRLEQNRAAAIQFDRSKDMLAIYGDEQLVEQLVTLVNLVTKPPSVQGQSLAFVRTEKTPAQKLHDAINAFNDSKGPSSDSNQNRSNSIDGSDNSNRSQDSFSDQQSMKRTLTPLPSDSRIRQASFLSPIISQDLQELPDSNNNAAVIPNTPTRQDGNLPDFGGNVDVELLPDLDVIILRGRDQDLQQLADIIEQLEMLSQQTQPEVEVYALQHTSADAMAQVIRDVLPELVEGRQGRITITSLSKPNSLLLIGWGDAVVAAKTLITQLDQPVDPASQFKIYRFKNASAVQAQTALQTFLNSRPELGTRANFVVDERTNSVIVSASPRDLNEIDRLMNGLDINGSMAISRAQLIQAKHMLASDLADTLQVAINAIQQGDSRSAILELLTIDQSGAEVIRSGALKDISVTAQVRNNSILVTAPPESMELVMSLIQQLDHPGSTAQMKIFKIVHSDAGSVVQVLRSLLPSETTTGQPFKLPNSSNATSIVPLRFSIDSRTNSVLVIGNEADLNVVEALVLRLDEQDALDRKTVVYHLKNAPARDISAAINQFLVNQRQLNLASPGSVNPYQQLEQEVIIVPEPVGNRLILSATSRYFDEISLLIQKLDEAPPQVMIQVLIAEVTLNNADEFGVELGLQDTVLFDRGLLGDLLTTVNTTASSTASGVVTITEEVVQSATNQPGFNFNSTSNLGNSGSDKSLATSKNVGGQGISNFSVGRVNSELGFGGLVLSASGRNVTALLRALQESRRLEILSRPQIRSLDNQPAYIQVGQRVPRIIGSTVNQNGQTNTVALENVGLIMGVTPRISPDGTVVMEIDAEKSQLGPELEGIPVSVSADGTIIRSPRIDTTTAQATVSAASGETIVLGGLITKSSQQINRKVPWLGDLPLVRNLFRFDSNIEKRTELVIILTPHVIRSSMDSDRIKEMELARMSWCAADVYQLHGDIDLGQEFYDIEAETQVIYPDGSPPELPLLPAAQK